jgi:hypothetical protein
MAITHPNRDEDVWIYLGAFTHGNDVASDWSISEGYLYQSLQESTYINSGYRERKKSDESPNPNPNPNPIYQGRVTIAIQIISMFHNFENIN